MNLQIWLFQNKKTEANASVNICEIKFNLNNLRLIIQHQRHYQHQQFFTFALLSWFYNTSLGGCA